MEVQSASMYGSLIARSQLPSSFIDDEAGPSECLDRIKAMPTSRARGVNLRLALERMCHAAVIANSKNASETIQRLVQQVLLLTDGESLDLSEVAEGLSESFGLEVPERELVAALSTLEREGQLQVGEGRYRLPAQIAGELRANTERLEELESTVIRDWHDQIGEAARPTTDETGLDIALHSFLAKLLQRHGVRAVELIEPQLDRSAEPGASVSELLNEVVNGHRTKGDSGQLEAALRSFLEGAVERPKRLEYIAMLADTAFSYFAVSIPREVTDSFRQRLRNVVIFFDTNALFGIANINVNVRDAVGRVAEYASKPGLPFSLRFHPRTLEEFRAAVDFQVQVLGAPTTSTASIALLNRGVFVNDVQRRYHELNARQALTITEYKERLRLAERVFQDRGVEIYRENFVLEGDVNRVTNEYRQALSARYSRKRIPQERQKPDNQIEHDGFLLALTYAVRSRQLGPDSVGALLLTLDGTLVEFDRVRNRGEQGYSQNGSAAANANVVFPETLLQLLRFFTPTEASAEYSWDFARMIALPAFRTQSGVAAEASQRVSEVLARFGDLSAEVAEEVLANDTLMQRITEGLSGEQLYEELDQVVAEQVRQLQSRLAGAIGRERELADKLLETEERYVTLQEKREVEHRELGQRLQAAIDEAGSAHRRADDADGKVADYGGLLENLREKVQGLEAGHEAMQSQNQRQALVLTALLVLFGALASFIAAYFVHPLIPLPSHDAFERIPVSLRLSLLVGFIIVGVRHPNMWLWMGLTGLTVVFHWVFQLPF